MGKFSRAHHATVEMRRGQAFAVLDDREVFVADLGRYVGKRIQLSVDVLSGRRSLNQNRFYRGVVIPLLAENFGYSQYEHEELHQLIADKFLGEDRETKLGRLRYRKSTADLDTKEFEEFLDEIRAWALAEYQINVPYPNEVDYV